MNQIDDLEKLKSTISVSVSPYHCIQESIAQLSEAGFEELPLSGNWSLVRGHSYYINVFDSTLIGFYVGADLSETPSLRIASAHTDWPCLKLKPSPEVTTSRYGKLNVEVYGGPILSTWMDRPLSMAGKVCLQGQDVFHPETRFVDFKKPLLTIPNLAIHMNREVNSGVALNPQVDMLPLITLTEKEGSKEAYLLHLLASRLDTDPDRILDYELYLYNPEEGMILGIHDEFYSSPRLDNITSVQACLSGITDSRQGDGIHVIALYDNEEIGSKTKQGAASALTDRILEKIYLSLGFDRCGFLNALSDGFLLSIDVAHAMHPNHTEKCDIKNKIELGDGVSIKMSASQSYATDASAVSVIEGICKAEQIPYKKFSNRSDMKGGSTLGSISSCLLAMKTVDIGVPLLAMHSAREVMGAKDQTALVSLTKKFFEA